MTAALRRTCDSDITSFSKHAAYSARVDCYVAVRVTVQSDVTGEPPAARGKRLESMTSRETLIFLYLSWKITPASDVTVQSDDVTGNPSSLYDAIRFKVNVAETRAIPSRESAAVDDVTAAMTSRRRG